jgi:NADPH-dependent curcumin reductase CurA
MRLVARPVGIPQPEHFALVTGPLPQIADGEMLVRNHYLSVDPAQRGWANDEGNYSAPVPLDTPMRALAVGEVIESRAPGFPKGEFLCGWFGWQSYCAATPDIVLRRVDPSTPLRTSLVNMEGKILLFGPAILSRQHRHGPLILVTHQIDTLLYFLCKSLHTLAPAIRAGGNLLFCS